MFTNIFVVVVDLNVSVLHNVSAESDHFGELGLDLSTFNTEEITDTFTDTVQSKSNGERDMNMKIEETGSDVTQRPNLDEQQTSDIIHKDNKDEQTEPIPSAPNTTYTQTAEFEEHLVPFAQTVNHYTTPPTKTTASQSALTESVQAIPQPSLPSISQNASTSVITNTASVSETTPATPMHHIPTSTAKATGSGLLKNASHTSDDVIVELHAMNNSKLPLLEEVSINSTAVAARAGPIAKALPSVSKGKPKNKTIKPKSNRVKTKPKKLPRKERGKKKTLKKGRKEKKQRPTTASHFPYFEDHYCPPQCSCYGRYVSDISTVALMFPK